MKYEYSIHGPFTIKRHKGHKNKKIVERTEEAKKKFWAIVEKRVPDLPSACGCYLFAIKTAKAIKPWYVGLAEKRGFQKECLSVHKISIYNEVLNEYGTGKPILFFIAKRTKERGAFAKPSKKGRKDIQSLETMLITTARENNHKLKNKMKTKYLRNMRVPGLINTPQVAESGVKSLTFTFED